MNASAAQAFKNAAPFRPTTSPADNPLPFEWFAEIEPRLDGLWLIKKLLPANGLALIYGHPGSGKSFLALDFAFHVALGWPWNGRRTQRGLVVYVGAEGGNGLRNRIVAFRRHNTIEGKIPLVLIGTPIDLQAVDADTPRLIEAIRTAKKDSGVTPALIVIDTLSKTFGAGKENTDDMATYVANCQRIASEFDCCVMPVHHRPKDEANGEPRGHGSLKGGVDTVILVEAGKPKRVSVTKQKDADADDDMAFNLAQVVLGQDEDGEDVTSCVVEFADAPKRSVNGRRLSEAQTMTMKALAIAMNDHGKFAPANLPADLISPGITFKVVSLDAWRSVAVSMMANPDKDPDNARRTFVRNCNQLQSAGIVNVWDGVAWPTK